MAAAAPVPSAPLSKSVLARMDSLGFVQFGVVDLQTFDQQIGDRLRDFVGKDYHGSMAWMMDTLDRRHHPNAMWPEARSALVVGFNYGPNRNPLENLEHSDIGNISVYARHQDYHGLIKGKLKELAGLIARDTDADVKVFVDTAPLMEKPLAALGDLGWQGKHTNLISREFGSWLFLGVVLSAARLSDPRHDNAPSLTNSQTDTAPPPSGDCGSCRACLDVCPTNAFPAAYQLDARLCISYLTIEYRGMIEEDLRPKLGNRIYGCDDCLSVCPWNKFAQNASEAKLIARVDLQQPSLLDLVQLDDVQFRELFKNSPIKRIGSAQFLRNVLYAVGNADGAPQSVQDNLLVAITPYLVDPRPIIQDAAVWAKRQLTGAPE